VIRSKRKGKIRNKRKQEIDFLSSPYENNVQNFWETKAIPMRSKDGVMGSTLIGGSIKFLRERGTPYSFVSSVKRKKSFFKSEVTI
jgi:hypothetical protein